jgi:hypothetical protein
MSNPEHTPGQLPAWWDPEQPFVDDYPDTRSAQQLSDDQHRVRRQVVNLGLRGQDASIRRELVRAIIQRRNVRLARAAEPNRQLFEPVLSERGFEMLVAGGELLIRSEALEDPRVQEFLDAVPFGQDEGEREFIDGLDGRVVRLVNRTLPSDRLDDVAQFLRRRGVQVSLNYIAPSGPVGKALAGPEPTEATLEFPATGPISDVDVAVVDTGIAADTRTDGWLAQAYVPRDGNQTGPNEDPLYDPPPPPQVLTMSAGHGSSVAGVIQRVEPGARILVYRALDEDGLNDEVQVAIAMVQAVRNGAGILNLSLGTETVDDQPPIAMQVALELIDGHGGDEVAIVAAAGNYGSTRPCWPAAFRRVVSVASLTWDGRPSDWSNRGFWIDCSTVGEGLLTPYVEGVESALIDWEPDRFTGPNPWALWSGTSFAAPQVAGAIARLCRTGRTPRQAVRELLRTGISRPDFGKAFRFLPGT